MARILLTGATGCTGSYLLKQLTEHHEVLALARRPERLIAVKHAERVRPIQGDLQLLLTEKSELLKHVDYCVHPATVWGGEDTFKVNVKQTLSLIQRLDQQGCRGIHYFSTASLLNSGHQFQPQALSLGTDYIRSKACAHQGLEQMQITTPLHTYYPTVIFGGDAVHPMTPVQAFLPQLRFYLPLVKWIKANASFHWIHAEDIAQVVAYRIAQDLPAGHFVLGNPALSIAELQRQLLRHHRMKPSPFQWDLERLLPVLLPLLASRMSPWDRFSLRHKNTVYHTLSAARYHLPSAFTQIADVLPPRS